MSDSPSSPLAADAESEQARRLCAAFLALREARQANQALRAELQSLRSSRSWRLTAPLRRLRSAWQGAPTPASTLAPGATSGEVSALPDPAQLLRQQVLPERRRVPSTLGSRPRLFVDVTELDREDHGAGVQRVVRRILEQWLIEPPPGLRVEPVRLSAQGHYVHARTFLARMLGLDAGAAGADLPLQAQAGDVFLGLDLIRDHAAVARPALARLRAEGLSMRFVVYDLLPLQRPDWFPPGVAQRFGDWLDLVAEFSEQLLCISDSVAGQLQQCLAQRAPACRARLGRFPMGADLDALATERPQPPRPVSTGSRWLMVGTLEPRKGHEQALAAFEQLWRKGLDLHLVFAGRTGWAPPGFLQGLRAHPELGRRLHWLADLDDADLLSCYRQADVLLAASQGEGFGLPLVEAAAQGLPILARDLPVFREVAGAGADYFQGEDAEALVRAIEDWLARQQQGRLADPSLVIRHDWRAAAAALQEQLQLR